jgi:Rhodopsin-like GPCR transmembrane domain
MVLDILSKIFQASSEVCMSMLLILMAQGWTVLH